MKALLAAVVFSFGVGVAFAGGTSTCEQMCAAKYQGCGTKCAAYFEACIDRCAAK